MQFIWHDDIADRTDRTHFRGQLLGQRNGRPQRYPPRGGPLPFGSDARFLGLESDKAAEPDDKADQVKQATAEE
jgi:hypothetical protein